MTTRISLESTCTRCKGTGNKEGDEAPGSKILDGKRKWCVLCGGTGWTTLKLPIREFCRHLKVEHDHIYDSAKHGVTWKDKVE